MKPFFVSETLSSHCAVTAFLLLGAVSGCGSGDSGQGPVAGLAAHAAQGTVDGGGGKGVLCRGHGTQRKLWLLDLYESEVIRGEVPDTIGSGEAVDYFGQYGAKKLGPMVETPAGEPVPETELKLYLRGIYREEFEKRLRPIAGPLPLTQDASLPDLPDHCEIVQIAIWKPNGEIALDRELAKELTPRDMAALAMHEYLYYIARETGATTSDESRWIIGTAFSSEPIQRRFPEKMFSPTHEKLWCYGGGEPAPLDGPVFEIYAQNESEAGIPGVAFYLQYTGSGGKGRTAMTRTRSFAPHWNLELLNQKRWPKSVQFQNRFHGTGWTFDFIPDFEVKNAERASTLPALSIVDPDGTRGVSRFDCLPQ